MIETWKCAYLSSIDFHRASSGLIVDLLPFCCMYNLHYAIYSIIYKYDQICMNSVSRIVG